MPKPSKAILLLVCLFGFLVPLTFQPLASIFAQWIPPEQSKGSSLKRLDPRRIVLDVPADRFVGGVPDPYPPVPVSPDLSDFSPPQGTTHPKLESGLSQVVQGYALGQDIKTLARWKGIPIAHDRLQVIIETDTDATASVISQMGLLGVPVQATYQQLVQALAQPGILTTLASIPGVRFVRRPLDFFPQALTSEGVRKTGASAWQQHGFQGQGARVAVVDQGFLGYRSLLGKELPTSPITRSFIVTPFTSDGVEDLESETEHGTAITEILYDMAPDATFYLVAISTEVELAKAIEWLIQEKIQIVSFSLGALASQTDGTSITERLVDKARANGILWVSAAGNYGAGHWQGVFSNPSGDGWQEFSPGQRLLPLDIGAQEVAFFLLKWDDWPNSKQDFGFYLFWEAVGSSLQLVSFSDTEQTGDQPPVEIVVALGPPRGKYYLAVKKFKADREIHLQVFSLVQDLPNGIPAGSIVSPASARGALAVGATNGFDQLQKYSSRGPTEDGRTKPDLVAPDAVTTVTYGKLGFPGTSASVPHVAGAAAVLLSAYPEWTAKQLQDYLEQNAAVLGQPGKNNEHGAGRLQLGMVPEVAPVATPTAASTSTPIPTPTGTLTPTRTPTPIATTSPEPSPTGVAWPDHYQYIPFIPKQAP